MSFGLKAYFVEYVGRSFAKLALIPFDVNGSLNRKPVN